MIKALRIDHRLLHGQVAFSWTSAIGADCILLASDSLIKDQLRLQTIKLAKPSGIKVVAKSIKDSLDAIESGITNKYKLFIIVENIKDAAVIARRLGIKKINLGGTLPSKDKYEIGTAVFVNDEDISLLEQLNGEGIEVFLQGIPTNKAINVISAIKNVKKG